jgi:hypothetical protein
MVRSNEKAVGSQIEPFTKSWSEGTWLKQICRLVKDLFGRSPEHPQKVARVVCAGPFSWIDSERPKESTASEAVPRKRQ